MTTLFGPVLPRVSLYCRLHGFRHSISPLHYFKNKLVVLSLFSAVLFALKLIAHYELSPALNTLEHASLLSDLVFAFTANRE